MLDLNKLNFEKGGGFVTIVSQDAGSGAVLMVARADREALQRTLSTGEMHYHSRSRGLWRKGETSGNVQKVVSLVPDCDGDAVLARIEPAGPACHTGARSCFGPEAFASDPLSALDLVIEERANTPQAEGRRPSYTQKLLADRNLRLKKVGEEAAELVVACADADKARSAEEAADLIYHALVALRSLGVTLGDVRKVLADRSKAREGSPNS